jgi:hypothetical protein
MDTALSGEVSNQPHALAAQPPELVSVYLHQRLCTHRTLPRQNYVQTNYKLVV